MDVRKVELKTEKKKRENIKLETQDDEYSQYLDSLDEKDDEKIVEDSDYPNEFYPETPYDKIADSLLEKTLELTLTNNDPVFTYSGLNMVDENVDPNLLYFINVTKDYNYTGTYNVILMTSKYSLVYNLVDKSFLESKVVDIMREFSVRESIIENFKKTLI